MKRLLYKLLRKDMIRRLKVKHGEQFIEDVMQTFDLSFDWRKMQYPPPPPPSVNMRSSFEFPERPVIKHLNIENERFLVTQNGKTYMADINDLTPWPTDNPELKNLPDCNHNQFCDQQTIFQTCKQEAGCNFKE